MGDKLGGNGIGRTLEEDVVRRRGRNRTKSRIAIDADGAACTRNVQSAAKGVRGVVLNIDITRVVIRDETAVGWQIDIRADRSGQIDSLTSESRNLSP